MEKQCGCGMARCEVDNKPTHTPTPWKVKGNLNTIEGANGLTVCDLADADAAYIVRAVNSHDELVEDLATLFHCFKDKIEPAMVARVERHLKQAITKAEGK